MTDIPQQDDLFPPFPSFVGNYSPKDPSSGTGTFTPPDNNNHHGGHNHNNHGNHHQRCQGSQDSDRTTGASSSSSSHSQSHSHYAPYGLDTPTTTNSSCRSDENDGGFSSSVPFDTASLPTLSDMGLPLPGAHNEPTFDWSEYLSRDTGGDGLIDVSGGGVSVGVGGSGVHDDGNHDMSDAGIENHQDIMMRRSRQFSWPATDAPTPSTGSDSDLGLLLDFDDDNATDHRSSPPGIAEHGDYPPCTPASHFKYRDPFMKLTNFSSPTLYKTRSESSSSLDEAVCNPAFIFSGSSVASGPSTPGSFLDLSLSSSSSPFCGDFTGIKAASMPDLGLSCDDGVGGVVKMDGLSIGDGGIDIDVNSSMNGSSCGEAEDPEGTLRATKPRIFMSRTGDLFQQPVHVSTIHSSSLNASSLLPTGFIDAQRTLSKGTSGSSTKKTRSAIDLDFSSLPTKRSRGRRPPCSDLASDVPTLTTEEQVRYCGVTKTGKPKKVFFCRVPQCGKIFRRCASFALPSPSFGRWICHSRYCGPLVVIV